MHFRCPQLYAAPGSDSKQHSLHGSPESCVSARIVSSACDSSSEMSSSLPTSSSSNPSLSACSSSEAISSEAMTWRLGSSPPCSSLASAPPPITSPNPIKDWRVSSSFLRLPSRNGTNNMSRTALLCPIMVAIVFLQCKRFATGFQDSVCAYQVLGHV